jgi:hypothetical protein
MVQAGIRARAQWHRRKTMKENQGKAKPMKQASINDK